MLFVSPWPRNMMLNMLLQLYLVFDELTAGIPGHPRHWPDQFLPDHFFPVHMQFKAKGFLPSDLSGCHFVFWHTGLAYRMSLLGVGDNLPRRATEMMSVSLGVCPRPVYCYIPPTLLCTVSLALFYVTQSLNLYTFTIWCLLLGDMT